MAMTPDQAVRVRKLAGLAQPNAAVQLGIGLRTLQRIEAGTYGDPIPEKYRRLILTLRSEK